MEVPRSRDPSWNGLRGCGGYSAGERPRPTKTRGASTRPPPVFTVTNGSILRTAWARGPVGLGQASATVRPPAATDAGADCTTVSYVRSTAKVEPSGATFALANARSVSRVGPISARAAVAQSRAAA